MGPHWAAGPLAVVWVAGFDPATSCSRSRRASRLRYTQIGRGGWNRTSVYVLPRHVGRHCPTPRWRRRQDSHLRRPALQAGA